MVPGAWTHVAATFTDDRIAVFVNGVQVGEGGNRPRVAGPYDLAYLGCGLGVRSGPASFFDGDLSEVRLWSRSLTESEIRNSLARRPDPSSAGLMCLWPLSEGHGQTCLDLSPNQSHGTLGSTLSPEPEDPQWTGVRDTALPVLLRSGSSRIGQTLSMVTVADLNATWLLFLGLGESSIVVPPFGTLRIAGDPAAVWLMDLGFIQTATVLDVSDVLLPNRPELVGVDLFWQGLAMNLFTLSGTFTNSVRVTLRG